MPRPEVFLSHASRDRKFVERIAETLDSQHIRYFYSTRHIQGAQQWHDELGEALDRCNWLVVVLTPSAVRSEWVKRELLFALRAKQYRNHIVPVLKSCAIKKLSWTLPGFQHVDFRRSSKAGERALLAALRVGRRASRGKRSTPS
jgi:hypothetical protein